MISNAKHDTLPVTTDTGNNIGDVSDVLIDQVAAK